MQVTTQSINDFFDRMRGGCASRMGYELAGLDFDAWQATFREELIDLLRLRPINPDPPPVEVMEIQSFDGYSRHLLHLHTDDGVVVPMFMLVPDGIAEPVPAVLAIHGHGPGKCIPVGQPPAGYDRQGMIVEGQRDYAVQAVRAGMIAIAPDLRGMGELVLDDEVSRREGRSCVQMSMRAIQCGQTLLGMRVADLMQIVTWLRERPDVDADRIAATGNSGGGTCTLFLAAVDTRVAAAVPSCYFCTFADSILAIHHCPDNYVPDLQLYGEMYDVAGLIAPRPLLIVAGKDDPIFPLAGVRNAYAKLEKIYAAADAADRLELYVGDGGHRYFSQRVWPFLAEKFGA
ncbi:MAG TPA: alpha/beta hydrolase family protein [Phycisphaerae bacterium]|nr:alpha/beta hydrolase family protein [Phycisphaerae bacterium]